MSYRECGPALLGLAAASSVSAQVCPDWQQRFVQGPPARRLGAMAYDRDRGVTVLLGGADERYERRYDTWEWDGSMWALRSTATPPCGRFSAGMAYDVARAATTVFGGFWSDCINCSFHSGQTWAWNGTDWTWIDVRGPLERAEHAMVYDAQRSRIVLFGGLVDDGVRFFWGDDTWEWDGATWTERMSPVRPPGRRGPGMVYDECRGVMVLFGGLGENDVPLGDTWELDAGGWRQVAASGPAPRAWHAMIYHEERQTVLLVGGGDQLTQPSAIYGDTWEWDGGQWRELSLPTSPSPRLGHSIVYDRLRGVALLFGGQGAQGTVNGETWELCLPGPCYPDCDTTTGQRILDIFDFLCFQNRYAAGAPYACDCDTSTGPGVCDVFDFLCFQNAFAAGCR